MNDDQRQFLETHRFAVLGVERRDGPPHLSPVYYVLDGDDLLISVTQTRAKTAMIRRTRRLSLCVLHEQFPFPYVRVEGRATIENDGAAALMMRIGEKMTGAPLADSVRPTIEERAKNEKRVVLRLTPESIFTPTRR